MEAQHIPLIIIVILIVGKLYHDGIIFPEKDTDENQK